MKVQINGLKHLNVENVIATIAKYEEGDILAYGIEALYKDASDKNEELRDEAIVVETLCRMAIAGNFTHLLSISAVRFIATYSEEDQHDLDDLEVIDFAKYCYIYMIVESN